MDKTSSLEIFFCVFCVCVFSCLCLADHQVGWFFIFLILWWTCFWIPAGQHPQTCVTSLSGPKDAQSPKTGLLASPSHHPHPNLWLLCLRLGYNRPVQKVENIIKENPFIFKLWYVFQTEKNILIDIKKWGVTNACQTCRGREKY